MKVEIDPNSGFCHGVVRAIRTAEDFLKNNNTLYCLGDIVHNSGEVKRLKEKGLITITYNDFRDIQKTKVLFRAHGEPPETYKIASKRNIEIIDTTCQVVLSLQKKIKEGYEEMKKSDGQIVIFGKKGHAEVIGLEGQANNEAIIIAGFEDLNKIDYNKPVLLYSQTTKDPDEYFKMSEEIKKKYIENNKSPNTYLKTYKTICKQVSNRKPLLSEFCNDHDVIIFVSGKKSSNGQMLFELCKKVNKRAYFISSGTELNKEWFDGAKSVGISGATSTPKWLMEEIEKKIKSYNF